VRFLDAVMAQSDGDSETPTSTEADDAADDTETEATV